MIIQPGLHGAGVLAEAQHHAKFIGLHPEETPQRPNYDDGGDRDDHAGRADAAAAGKEALQPVLATPDQVFKVGVRPS